MKNIKNKLIFVLTAATLAAGLTVSASAQSFTCYGTSCPGNGTDWNTILSKAGGSNCLSDSDGFTSPYGSVPSNVLSSSDLNSLLGNLYSYCPSGQAPDSTGGLAGTQSNTAGTSQTCPNTAKQAPTDQPSAANVQAAADKNSCPTTASKQPDSSTDAAAEASSPSEKAVTGTKTVAQTAKTKAAEKTEAAAQSSSAPVKEATPAASSAPAAASAPASSSCNTAANQSASCSNASQSGNTLMQCIDSFLKKCGIDLNSLGITLPGCGNTTVSNGTDETAQQPGTSGNTDTSNPTTPSGSGQSDPTTTPPNQSGSGSSNTQDADNQSFEEQVAELVNEQRAANGLQPLTLSTALSNAARTKSQDMHDNHYFAHESPTYGSPFDMLKSFGISYRSAGENIAVGYATPEAVMNAWMNSSGHRANILNASYTQIGVGYVADGNYWTQEFTG